MNNSLDKREILELVDQPYDDNLLEAYTVGKDIYNTRIDTNVEAITEKVNYPELDSNTLF